MLMKTSKKERKRLIFISSVILILITTLVISSYNDWKTILENNSKVLALETQYQNLIDSEKSLKSEVTKLSDPEYVARYAKEKYMYSVEGEVIIRID